MENLKSIPGFQSTIAHRQLFLWVDENFVPGYYGLKFVDKNTAIITDMKKDSMTIRYTEESGVVVVE